MKIYHEVTKEVLDRVLKEGLKRTSRGEKGNDPVIIKTDRFLDDIRPDYLIAAGISRCNNLYGYCGDDDTVIDIRNGEVTPIQALTRKNTQSLLCLSVTPECCYVSDLDAYDSVKNAVEKKDSPEQLRRLGESYWKKLVRLDKYRGMDISRPELLITCDISPDAIKVIKA